MRIAITGPQNTGKSTFISDLLLKYSNFKQPQRTYRDVIREKGLDLNQKTTQVTQALIRDFMVDQLQEDTGDVIYDRCLLDNFVYTTWMTSNDKTMDDTVKYQTELMMLHYIHKYDYILFIPFDPTIELKKSEQRDIDPNFIRDINALFIKTIIEYRIPNVITIYGNREQRVKQFEVEFEVDKIMHVS